MKLRSRGLLHFAVPLAVVWLLPACTQEDREQPLTQVQPIQIPAADTTTRVNFNIDNPTLEVPETFPVSDGDLLTLVWSDEFNGAELDPEVWFFATGDGTEKGLPGGWGNNELQYYLPDNARLEDGKLKITAKRETVGDLNYTSARINTEDRFAFKYGRIEASIKMPSGQGLWPAFWMLSQDSDYLCDRGDKPPEPCVWAAIGEIDIVEAINLDGTNGNEIFATIHYGDEAPGNQSSSVTYTPSEDVTEGFNTYALEWDEFEIRWYFNGLLYAVQNMWDSAAINASYPAPFNQNFHILLNLAVGGNFPGPANSATPFPATMEVDWVRVYSGEDNYVPADRGTVPDVVIYPFADADLVFGEDYTGFDPFTSGTTYDGNVTLDRDFSPAFGVTVGFGYGAWIGQYSIFGFDAGFAAAYESLQFKAKGLNNDIIRVKLLPSDPYIDIDLTDSPYSTELGNGWYEVVVPMTAFANVEGATAVLFETDNAAPGQYTFLLTEFGFNVADGGGGGGGGGGAGELADNGGFEEAGTLEETGWTVFPNGGSISVVNDAFTGTSAARLVAGTGQNPLIKQQEKGAGIVSQGDTINVSFNMKGSVGPGGVVFVEFFSENSAGVNQTFLLQPPVFPMADWTPYSFTPTVAGDAARGITLQIAAVCGGDPGCTVDIVVDDISMSLAGGD